MKGSVPFGHVEKWHDHGFGAQVHDKRVTLNLKAILDDADRSALRFDDERRLSRRSIFQHSEMDGDFIILKT